jgi:serine phosphatase RsbU (regulator of sigma subunit)/anti-sigma regulatory factor (Ser/Thr protein kinase)
MPATAVHPNPVRIRLQVPCALDAIRPMADRARNFLRQQSLPEEDVAACELALVEACNNAVKYTEDSERVWPIEVELVGTPATIEIRVDDHTPGFELPTVVELPEPGSENGRGLFIIKSIMDDVHYFTGDGKNTLVMTKLRPESGSRDGRFSSQTLQEFTSKLVESEQIINDMAEELSSCYETLSAIFRCGAELGKTNNLQDFSRSLCNDLLQITGADWYVLRVVSVEEPRLIHFPALETGQPLRSLSLDAGHDIIGAELQAAGTRHDVWFNESKPLHAEDPLRLVDVEAIGVVHPFFFADNLMGTLTVAKHAGKIPFTAAQANVVHTFADFLAIQIVNARLQEEQLKSRLVSRELEIAKTIQQALLPKILPQPHGFGLAGHCYSARQVGGDFYDVVQVSESSLLLIIADVMGKGIPAAMFAAILRSLLRAAPEFSQNPGALLARVNRLLYEDLSQVEMFITAEVVYLDLEKRKLIAASAGHCPILLGSPNMENIQAISPDGIPLGILSDAAFETQVMDLPAGARLLLYTDGLTEAQDGHGNFFGDQKLLEWFRKEVAGATPADELKRSLAVQLQDFQGTSALYDDQTFLVLADEEQPRRNYVRENFVG